MIGFFFQLIEILKNLIYENELVEFENLRFLHLCKSLDEEIMRKQQKTRPKLVKEAQRSPETTGESFAQVYKERTTL